MNIRAGNGPDDRDAGFRELARRLDVSLHRSAYLLCGDWHLAEDLVQETLAKAYAHWRRVQHADSPDAYVQRIPVNEARQRWRRREPPVLRGDAVVREQLEPDAAESVVRRAELFAALLRLPVRQRAAVVLRYLDGLSERGGCGDGRRKRAARLAGPPGRGGGLDAVPPGCRGTRLPSARALTVRLAAAYTAAQASSEVTDRATVGGGATVETITVPSQKWTETITRNASGVTQSVAFTEQLPGMRRRPLTVYNAQNHKVTLKGPFWVFQTVRIDYATHHYYVDTNYAGKRASQSVDPGRGGEGRGRLDLQHSAAPVTEDVLVVEGRWHRDG
jgi:RNA polymerase sigma factor (sigma-70 family)